MNKFNAVIVGGLAAFGATAVAAQDAQPGVPPSTADVHASHEAPAADAAAEAQAEGEIQVAISPQDIDNFAKAAVKLREVQADTSLDEAQKQAAMTAAVEENNLDTVKFNAIAEASQTNPELRQRVELALAQQQQQQGR